MWCHESFQHTSDTQQLHNIKVLPLTPTTAPHTGPSPAPTNTHTLPAMLTATQCCAHTITTTSRTWTYSHTHHTTEACAAGDEREWAPHSTTHQWTPPHYHHSSTSVNTTPPAAAHQWTPPHQQQHTSEHHHTTTSRGREGWSVSGCNTETDVRFFVFLKWLWIINLFCITLCIFVAIPVWRHLCASLCSTTTTTTCVPACAAPPPPPPPPVCQPVVSVLLRLRIFKVTSPSS